MKLRQYYGMTEEVTTGVINSIVTVLFSFSSQTIFSEAYTESALFPQSDYQLNRICWIICDYLITYKTAGYN